MDTKALRILIFIPTYTGNIKVACMSSLLRLTASLRARGISHAFSMIDKTEIAIARNIAGSIVVKDRTISHLLAVDADMQFQPDDVLHAIELDRHLIGYGCVARHLQIDKLLDAARAGKTRERAIAEASEFTFRAFPDDDVRELVNRSNDGTIEVAGVGFGLTLVRREVFDTLASSTEIRVADDEEVHGPPHNLDLVYGFFDQIYDTSKRNSEDFAFCHRWRKWAGGKVYAIIDRPIGHVGEMVFSSSATDLYR
jgi:hypothetical protein